MENTPLRPLSRGEFEFCYFKRMLNLTALPLIPSPAIILRLIFERRIFDKRGI